jgi:hypothetical protein
LACYVEISSTALDAHIHQLDPALGDDPPGFGQDRPGDLLAPEGACPQMPECRPLRLASAASPSICSIA